MSQGLQLSQKMALQQVLAPQLQQSLALLQAPVLELKALVEHELEHNPLLEELTPEELSRKERQEGGEATGADTDPSEPPEDMQFDPATDRPVGAVDDFQAEFDRLARVDQDWRDSFTETNAPMRGRVEEEERRQYVLDSLVAGTSLQEHLLEQVRLAEFTPAQRPIAEMIIGNIDDHGHLQANVNELAFATNYPADKVQEVLDVIQQTFVPAGVGARNLQECLLLQLDRLGRQESLEYRIVRDQMDALGRRRLPDIARALGRPIGEVQEAVARIAQLEPRPGRDFTVDDNHYVVPEIYVQQHDGEYVVTTNSESIPHLRISNTYKDIMAKPDSSREVREYIRERIRAGKFLIKSLQQRQDTLLSIGREIVRRQQEFMAHGVGGLKPMTMAQVAEAVGVHETTVSRAVAGKFMETPRGVFELKYFFTSSVPTSNGTAMSNESVKERLQEMVAAEDRGKPLSDEELVKRLAEQGIKIARRTVAKYRSELNILPSHLRKVY